MHADTYERIFAFPLWKRSSGSLNEDLTTAHKEKKEKEGKRARKNSRSGFRRWELWNFFSGLPFVFQAKAPALEVGIKGPPVLLLLLLLLIVSSSVLSCIHPSSLYLPLFTILFGLLYLFVCVPFSLFPFSFSRFRSLARFKCSH